MLGTTALSPCRYYFSCYYYYYHYYYYIKAYCTRKTSHQLRLVIHLYKVVQAS